MNSLSLTIHQDLLVKRILDTTLEKPFNIKTRSKCLCCAIIGVVQGVALTALSILSALFLAILSPAYKTATWADLKVKTIDLIDNSKGTFICSYIALRGIIKPSKALQIIQDSEKDLLKKPSLLSEKLESDLQILRKAKLAQVTNKTISRKHAETLLNIGVEGLGKTIKIYTKEFKKSISEKTISKFAAWLKFEKDLRSNYLEICNEIKKLKLSPQEYEYYNLKKNVHVVNDKRLETYKHKQFSLIEKFYVRVSKKMEVDKPALNAQLITILKSSVEAINKKSESFFNTDFADFQKNNGKKMTLEQVSKSLSEEVGKIIDQAATAMTNVMVQIEAMGVAKQGK